MNKNILYYLALALAVISCAKDELEEGASYRVTSIEVELPRTKVTVNEDDGKCMWDATDCIAVYDASLSRYVDFTLASGEGTGRAVFSNTEGAVLTDGASVLYPASYVYQYTDD